LGSRRWVAAGYWLWWVGRSIAVGSKSCKWGAEMNAERSLGQVLVGALFLVASSLVLFVGYRILRRRMPGFLNRSPAWWRANPRAGWLYACVFCAIGLWSLRRVVWRVGVGSGVAVGDLAVAIVFIVLAVLAGVWHEDLALWRADAEERGLQQAREQPWIPAGILFLVGLAFAVLGGWLVYDWLAAFS